MRKLTFRNETPLQLQIDGEESSAGTCVVVRLPQPSKCEHPGAEVRRVADVEWCVCCGAIRTQERWLEPRGSLQQRAYREGQWSALMGRLRELLGSMEESNAEWRRQLRTSPMATMLDALLGGQCVCGKCDKPSEEKPS